MDGWIVGWIDRLRESVCVDHTYRVTTQVRNEAVRAMRYPEDAHKVSPRIPCLFTFFSLSSHIEHVRVKQRLRHRATILSTAEGRGDARREAKSIGNRGGASRGNAGGGNGRGWSSGLLEITRPPFGFLK